jgi:hypothetical protein
MDFPLLILLLLLYYMLLYTASCIIKMFAQELHQIHALLASLLECIRELNLWLWCEEHDDVIIVIR